MKHKKGKVVAIAGLCLLTGCMTGLAQREGGFTLVTDAEGLQAWGDSQVGLVNETKASPDTKSSYWQTREQQVKAQSFRIVQPKKNRRVKR